MKPFQTPGAASWTELLTSDLSAATSFYQAVFGWDIQTMPMSSGDYAVATVAGEPGAGMMQRPQDEIPVYWGVYFTVSDAADSVAKARQLGATVIMEPMEAPEVGTFAVLQDPQGGVFNIMQYKEPEHEAHQRDWVANFGIHGAFSWYELRVPDAAAIAPFYADLFGWTLRVDQMGMGPYHIITVGGVDIGGILSVKPDEMPPHWGAYITVENLDAVLDSVRAEGGSILFDPVDVPRVGRFTMIADPQGGTLAAMQYIMPEG